MGNHKRVNAIVSAVVTLIALLTYLRTMAPTTSFWDCGEFIACSYTLGVPHPPGAPLYILVGRFFSMIPFAADIGFRVNIISAIASSLTIMFTYLIIVRLVRIWRGAPKSVSDSLILYASGAIGALAFAFTDSHWFNAVEAEVYAISLLVTAAVVWLILVWMEKADDPKSDRYLLLISYCIGLVIGVHLLSILALPAIFLIVYFRKFKPASFLEFLLHIFIATTLLAACVLITMLLGAVYVGLAAYLLGHYLYYRSKITEAAKRYTQLALILGIGVAVFAAIYPGIIKGIPYIADKWSLGALGVLVIVLLLATGFFVIEKQRWVALSLLSLFLIVLGFSTYSAILIRSGLNPAIDENNPEDTQGMVRYLNREQYGTWGTLPRRFPKIPMEWEFEQRYPGQNYKFFEFGKQIKFFWNYQLNKMYWRYFGWQYIGQGIAKDKEGLIAANIAFYGLYGLPFLLGLFGMVHHFFRDWKRALVILVLFVMTGIAIVVYLNQEDPQPRERDYVYTGSFFAFALWIGIGVAGLLEWVGDAFRDQEKRRRIALVVTSVMLLLIAPINLFAFNFESHDRSGNYVAYDYSYNLLQTCEKDAIVFTNGDNDTFPLWFLQEVYGIRKDVRVVNLSLLNTPWYIKQLRDEAPRVPIRMSDAEIEKLRPMPWKKAKYSIPVPPQARERDLADLGERKPFMDVEAVDKIVFEVAPTLMGQGIRVQDYMVLRILHDNQWRRPIYFAVTVSNDNKLELFDYLRMDGLDFKVVTIPGNYQISPERLKQNLFENFRYRNLDNPDVYYNDNIKGLLQNYRAAFLRLATHYAQDREYEDMLEVLEKMEAVLPESVIPIADKRAILEVGKLYNLGGRQDEFERRLTSIIDQYPSYGEAYGWLLALYEKDNRYQEASDLLERWLGRHPDDRMAANRMEEYRKKAAEATADSVVEILEPPAPKAQPIRPEQPIGENR